MKARTESVSDSAYDNSFERESPSSAAFNSPLIRKSHSKEEYNDAKKQTNGYLTNGGAQKNTNSTRYNHNHKTISDNFHDESDLQPLHFDTQEILEKTPAIFKSLSSSLRGPDTFVYLSSLKPLSHNDDPCKTFVISSDNTSFVNRKNSLNQTLAVNGFGNKTNIAKIDDNEYPSYVIDKNYESESSKMSDSKRNGRDHEDEESADELDGVIVGGKSNSIKTVNVNDRNINNHFDSDDVGKNNKNRNYSDESENCDKSVQSNGQSKSNDSGVLSFDRTITGRKELAFAKLQDELQKAHLELKLKDEEVTRLTRIREDVERELEELTASLFQEAHNMVSKAKEKQAAAEKSLAESQMKVDVLTAEVVALKTLVLTSTPSRPNPHLHPQIGKEESNGGVNLFNKKHRRSPSHFNLKYGRENSPPDSPVHDKSIVNNAVPNSIENRDISEVDPTVHKEFLNWSLNCKLDKTDPFIDRIYREDINLCLDFSNRELAEEVQKAIETRNIFIEALTDKSKTIFPRKCALLEVTRQCHYRMKLGDQDTWYNISQMCRNRESGKKAFKKKLKQTEIYLLSTDEGWTFKGRGCDHVTLAIDPTIVSSISRDRQMVKFEIIAVCDFINYLRYIELGLVKSSAHEMYWEIMRLRKEMVLARLGLSLPSS